MDVNKETPKSNSFKLKSLLEITKAINSNHSTDHLISLFENILFQHLHIHKIALYVFNKEWKCITKKGISGNFDEKAIIDKLVHYIEISRATVFSEMNDEMIIPVFHKTQPLAYLILGDLSDDDPKTIHKLKHLPFVQTMTNLICVAIENKKLAKENLMKFSVEKELELASKMQRMLFPSLLPNDKYIEIDAYYRSHHEVGGDFYDYFRLNEHEIVFCIADVSGKGISAALLMANFQANLRAAFRHSKKISEVLLELNPIVINNAKHDKFITLFVAHYNCVTRVLTYINAGHNPPLLFNKGTLQRLHAGCIGVGMLDEIPTIREGIINIDPESVLLCYTDGLTEQENVLGEEFGEERLCEIILSNAKLKDPKVLNAMMIQAFSQFTENLKVKDDVTLFTCHFK